MLKLIKKKSCVRVLRVLHLTANCRGHVSTALSEGADVCMHSMCTPRRKTTYTCGSGDGVGAGDEGLAVIQADENVHGSVKKKKEKKTRGLTFMSLSESVVEDKYQTQT